MPKSRPDAMHVAILEVSRKGRTYKSKLVRQSFRDEQGRPQKRTLANLSALPDSAVELLRGALQGKQYAALENLFPPPARSRLHGGIEAVNLAFRQLGLARLLSPRRCPQRDLVLAMIAGRILRPQTKTATRRWWETTTLPDLFEVADVKEDDLYAAMDWLHEQQPKIQDRLAKRWLAEESMVLFDLTSTWVEGDCCELAAMGYSRDRKRGKKQINFGLLCDVAGRPVSVSVHRGNIADPETLLPEIERLRDRFGLQRVVVVGDRGMVVQASIDRLRQFSGVEWITALRSHAIRALVRDRLLDPLDDSHLFELVHPDFPGERLVACRNPQLARRRRHTREDLLRATGEELEKIAARVIRGSLSGQDGIGLRVGEVINRYRMKKHFEIDITDDRLHFSRNADSIAAEAALDGIYVIRTSLTEAAMTAEDCVRSYKNLTRVERAFRTIKTGGLHVRPIHHRLDHRVRAHIFLVMLSYLVEWHMRKAWAPLLFADPDLESSSRTRDPVLPAGRSGQAEQTARTGRLPDGTQAHSFRTLLQKMDTIVTSTFDVPDEFRLGEDRKVEVTTTADALQRRALALLKEIGKMEKAEM